MRVKTGYRELLAAVGEIDSGRGEGSASGVREAGEFGSGRVADGLYLIEFYRR